MRLAPSRPVRRPDARPVPGRDSGTRVPRPKPPRRRFAARSAGSTAERAALLGLAGRYRYELGEERAALPLLQEYVALRPEDRQARYQLGCTLLRLAAFPRDDRPASLTDAMRKAEAASEAFLRCHEQDPADLDAALAATEALWRAAELADRVAKGAREEPEREVLRTSAAAHRRACRETLDRLEAGFPTAPEPSFHLAVLAERAGETAAAIAAYERALQRDGGPRRFVAQPRSAARRHRPAARRRPCCDEARRSPRGPRGAAARRAMREKKRIEAWLEQVATEPGGR
jgi:hypothetical protein